MQDHRKRGAALADSTDLELAQNGDRVNRTVSFRSGLSLGPNEGKVIAQVGPRPPLESPESQIMEWSEPGGWKSYKVALTAIRMCMLEASEAELVIMGASGYASVVAGSTSTEEMVDESRNGPMCRGNIRDMHAIGEHLYAAGMSRQVYRRESAMHWVHCDQGTVQPLGSLAVAGFSAIDGITESDIYAVGFNGEIWHYDGKDWRRLDSPTNLILHRVRAIGPDTVFASGQEGVLLQGSQNGWRAVDHGVTTDDLWGMDWFEGSLYVASDRAIYRFANGRLEAVDTNLGKSFTYRHLHANKGALWSFGPKHIAKTDGRGWLDVTPV
jgi:hypothetical protein